MKDTDIVEIPLKITYRQAKYLRRKFKDWGKMKRSQVKKLIRRGELPELINNVEEEGYMLEGLAYYLDALLSSQVRNSVYYIRVLKDFRGTTISAKLEDKHYQIRSRVLSSIVIFIVKLIALFSGRRDSNENK